MTRSRWCACGVIACVWLGSAVDAQAQSPGSDIPPPQPPPASAPQPAATPAGQIPAPPSSYTRSTGFVLRFGYEFGGDDLITVTQSSYLDTSSDTITAGGGFVASGGLIYHPSAPLTIEATFGAKWNNISVGQDSVSFWRLPFDVVVSGALGEGRIGVGATAHLSTTLSCHIGDDCDFSLKLDSAYGALFQFAFSHRTSGNSAFELGIRYTYIKYAKRDVSDAKIDGSNVGLFISSWL